VIKRVAISFAWLCVGLVISEALWRFWTPRCTEGVCPSWLGVSMIGACLLGPVIWGIGGFWSTRALSRPGPIFGVLLFANALLAGVLTLLA